MSAARIDSAGKVWNLDGRVEPDENITELDVQDPAKLSKLLGRVLASQATLRRNFVPRRLDFEDVAVGTLAAAVPLQHGLNGRVRWWIVDWTSSGTAAPVLRRGAATDSNTLVLESYVAGTATIRIEEAG